MNGTQALKRARELLGRRAMIRVRKPYCTPEQREAARVNRDAVVAAREASRTARDARRRELLAADAEYQRLSEAARQAQDDYEVACARMQSYAVSVGIDAGICFEIRAQGDTLADAIAKLEAKAVEGETA